MEQEQLIEMYKEAFHDNDNYVNCFFKNEVNKDNIVTYLRDGELVSSLYLIDKNFVIGDKKLTCPYIVGASTKEELRGKGLFKYAMKSAFTKINKENKPFCMLYPFKHSYYKKYGFVTVSFVKDVFLNEKEITLEKLDKKNLQVAYALYKEHIKKFNFAIDKTFNEFSYDFKKFNFSPNTSNLILKSGKPVGYYMVDGDGTFQFVTIDDKILSDEGMIKLTQIDNLNGDTEYLMLRIVDVIEAIKCFKPKKVTKAFTISIEDNMIESNNVILKISVMDGKLLISESKSYEYETDIYTLTKMLFRKKYNFAHNIFREIFEEADIGIFDKYWL